MKQKLTSIVDGDNTKQKNTLDVMDLLGQLAQREAEVLLLQQELLHFKNSSQEIVNTDHLPKNTNNNSGGQLQHIVSVTKHQIELERQEKTVIQQKLKDEMEINEQLNLKIKQINKELSEIHKKRKEEVNQCKTELETIQKTWYSPEQWTDLYATIELSFFLTHYITVTTN